MKLLSAFAAALAVCAIQAVPAHAESACHAPLPFLPFWTCNQELGIGNDVTPLTHDGEITHPAPKHPPEDCPRHEPGDNAGSKKWDHDNGGSPPVRDHGDGWGDKGDHWPH